MNSRVLIFVTLVAAALGLLFSSFSTFDFVQHLDRQVHGIHCSFIPGLSSTEVAGTGCHVTLMSPYSSVFRDLVWGGIPVSLPAMAVFAFLFYKGAEILIRRRDGDRTATGFLALAWALPVLTSLGMAYISLVELDAACKMCIGIYTASGLGLVGAIASRGLRMPGGGGWRALAAEDPDDGDDFLPDTRPADHAPAFGVGVGFVAAAVGIYLVVVPDFSSYVGTCGELSHPTDPYGVLLRLDHNPGGAAAIEILDPLCPSCKGFEDRLEASGLGAGLDRRVLLFPLDNACNWMVSSAVHPGACAISEAVLCAEQPAWVLAWAFENQENIKVAAASDPKAAAAMVVAAFPDLKGCVGSARVRSKLNKSLRWAVKNELPVLTPQLYVGGVKLCDEDTDLGLDYALSRLLAGSGT
jgi:uncharacterized membrane protein